MLSPQEHMELTGLREVVANPAMFNVTDERKVEMQARITELEAKRDAPPS